MGSPAKMLAAAVLVLFSTAGVGEWDVKHRSDGTANSPVPVSSKQQQAASAVGQDAVVLTGQVDKAVERARLALSGGRYQQALEVLNELSGAQQQRADFWLIKGSAHLGLGQLELADKAFASAQQLAPRNTQIALQRAVLKQERGDHIGALQMLENAAAQWPETPEVFLNQGYSQQALGAVREAGHSFRIFLRLTEGRSLYTGQRKAVNEWLAQF